MNAATSLGGGVIHVVLISVLTLGTGRRSGCSVELAPLHRGLTDASSSDDSSNNGNVATPGGSARAQAPRDYQRDFGAVTSWSANFRDAPVRFYRRRLEFSSES
jgi:hypothetical protein